MSPNNRTPGIPFAVFALATAFVEGGCKHEDREQLGENARLYLDFLEVLGDSTELYCECAVEAGYYEAFDLCWRPAMPPPMAECIAGVLDEFDGDVTTYLLCAINVRSEYVRVWRTRAARGISMPAIRCSCSSGIRVRAFPMARIVPLRWNAMASRCPSRSPVAMARRCRRTCSATGKMTVRMAAMSTTARASSAVTGPRSCCRSSATQIQIVRISATKRRVRTSSRVAMATGFRCRGGATARPTARMGPTSLAAEATSRARSRHRGRWR